MIRGLVPVTALGLLMRAHQFHLDAIAPKTYCPEPPPLGSSVDACNLDATPIVACAEPLQEPGFTIAHVRHPATLRDCKGTVSPLPA
jgi:hypothetical protein